jgi:hypothetical protein
MTRSRSFGETDKATFLAAIRTFRDALIQAQRTAPPTGDVYKATGPVLDALEELAEALVATTVATVAGQPQFGKGFVCKNWVLFLHTTRA